MVRVLLAAVLLAAVSITGFYVTNPPSVQASSAPMPTTGAQEKIAALQKKRINLLEKRVEQVKHWAQFDRVDSTQVREVELDLLDAKLEYAKSKLKKKSILAQILEHYDDSVELANLEKDRPRPIKTGHSVHKMADLEYLFLQAERTRYQILHDSQ